MNQTLLAISVAAAATLATPTLTAQSMIGISWSGTSYTVDAGTGAGVSLGSSGFGTTNSMAVVNGTLVTVQNGGDVIAIDPNTGSGTFVINVPALTSVRGLATDPTSGALYAINDNGFTSGVANPDSLYLVDLGSGTAIYIGDTNHGGLQGFAIDATGNAYAWDAGPGTGSGDGLVAVDVSGGGTFDIDPTTIGTSNDVQCLAFGPGGTLYGARSSLYIVDPSSGALTLVGGGGYSDLRGIEFAGAVPASCTSRNGSGANPVGCFCATLPQLGTMWLLDVPLTANAIASFCFVSPTQLPGIPVPGLGEVLIDNPVAALVSPAPGGFTLPIPASSTFAGTQVSAQGLLLLTGTSGLSLQLTNAMDGVLGQ